jgi:hypothetical protein
LLVASAALLRVTAGRTAHRATASATTVVAAAAPAIPPLRVKLILVLLVPGAAAAAGALAAFIPAAGAIAASLAVVGARARAVRAGEVVFRLGGCKRPVRAVVRVRGHHGLGLHRGLGGLLGCAGEVALGLVVGLEQPVNLDGRGEGLLEHLVGEFRVLACNLK